jgi:hypothetical protein
MPEKPKNENVQLPCRRHENTNASRPPENLPISGLYASFALRAVPEELRTELHLPDGVTYVEALATVLFNAAIKGNVPAAREIRESVEGKASPRRNPEGPQKFEIIVTYESPLLKMVPKDKPDAPHE